MPLPPPRFGPPMDFKMSSLKNFLAIHIEYQKRSEEKFDFAFAFKKCKRTLSLGALFRLS